MKVVQLKTPDSKTGRPLLLTKLNNRAAPGFEALPATRPASADDANAIFGGLFLAFAFGLFLGWWKIRAESNKQIQTLQARLNNEIALHQEDLTAMRASLCSQQQANQRVQINNNYGELAAVLERVVEATRPQVVDAPHRHGLSAAELLEALPAAMVEQIKHHFNPNLKQIKGVCRG